MCEYIMMMREDGWIVHTHTHLPPHLGISSNASKYSTVGPVYQRWIALMHQQATRGVEQGRMTVIKEEQ